jgi:hypothetical protein
MANLLLHSGSISTINSFLSSTDEFHDMFVGKTLPDVNEPWNDRDVQGP